MSEVLITERVLFRFQVLKKLTFQIFLFNFVSVKLYFSNNISIKFKCSFSDSISFTILTIAILILQDHIDVLLFIIVNDYGTFIFYFY